MVSSICTQLKYFYILIDILYIKDDLQHTSDASEICFHCRKKAGFKDPWAGMNETSIPSPLIFSIRGCPGQEWRLD